MSDSLFPDGHLPTTVNRIMTRTEIEAAKEEDIWCDIPDFPREDWMNEAREGREDAKSRKDPC